MLKYQNIVKRQKKTYTTELSTQTTTRKVKKEKKIRDRTKNDRQNAFISNLIKQSTKMNTGRNFIEEDKNAIKLYAIKIKKKKIDSA